MLDRSPDASSSHASPAAPQVRASIASSQTVHPLRDGLVVGLATLVTTVLMVAGQWFKACNALEDQVRTSLIQIAKGAAALVDGDVHKTFVRREQENTEAYRQALDPLRKIQKAISQIKYIYTVVRVDGRIYFVLDPTPPGDANKDGLDDHSYVMQPYDEDDPEMLAALTEGVCVANPQFRTDCWGTFISGYSPVYDSLGRQVGVVGIDFTAQEYEHQVATMYREAYLDLARAILVSMVAGCLVYGLRRHHRLLIARDILERKRAEESSQRHAVELQTANCELIAEKMVSDSHRQELVLANRQLNRYNLDLEAANKALQETYQRAEDATRVKSQFLATMSHELRTPLNGVIGMTELLRNTDLDPRQREFVNACHTSGLTLLHLINDILDFSKIEAGKIELEEHDFDLDSVVAETVDVLNCTAREKGLLLVSRVAPDIRGRVRGDSIRLRQVLVNLVSNAIKFTDSGQVSVAVTAVDAAAPAMVRFTVSDTGIGIPRERIDRLFKSFCQADSSTTRKYGGTGLGLAICKSLVELMGGAIGVESEAGRGSTFWFQIPLLPATSETQAEQSPVQASSIPVHAHGSLHGRRILLAEDNHINQMFVQEVLRRAGMECYTAASGLEVLAAIEREGFDLVLMDCQMPEMDGFEATVRIRHRESEGRLIGRLPIIALTANAVKGDRERCLEAGMDAYVSKPFTSDTLLDTIAQVLAVQAAVEEAIQASGPPSPMPETTQTTNVLFDCDALISRCMGSLELAQKLLAEFGNLLPGHVDRIAHHVRQGDARAAADSAHALKGAAGTLTAESVRFLAAQIEVAGKAGDIAAATSLMDQLHDAALRSAAVIPALHEEMARC